MRKKLVSGIFALFFCLGMVRASDIPVAQDVYLNDYANVLTSAERQTLFSALAAFRHTHKTHIVVVLQSNKPSAWQSRGLEAYARALFDTWGIGDKQRNDGVLLLILTEERESRIELGAAFGHRYDAKMKRVMDSVLIPHFKERRWAKAVHDFLPSIAELDPNAKDIKLLSKSEDTHPALKWLGIGFGGALVTGSSALLYFRRKRSAPRQCAWCGATMIRLSEEQDDQYLNEPQKKEESLRSVDYDVWQCSSCKNVQIEEYQAFFSAIETCAQCHHKTGKNTGRTSNFSPSNGYYLQFTCVQCHHQWERYVKPPQHNSSNNSGFGGGRSGGGGASGRW